jgi:hypothetical protein
MGKEEIQSKMNKKAISALTLTIWLIILTTIAIAVITKAIIPHKNVQDFTRECFMQIATKFCNEKMFQNSSTGGTWVVAFANISGGYFGCQAPCGHSGVISFNFSQDEICACNLECVT